MDTTDHNDWSQTAMIGLSFANNDCTLPTHNTRTCTTVHVSEKQASSERPATTRERACRVHRSEHRAGRPLVYMPRARARSSSTKKLDDDHASGPSSDEEEDNAIATGNPMERCAAILECLAADPIGAWFLEPVTEQEAPNYRLVVTDPIDFRTIRQKLCDNRYGEDQSAFASDVRRVYCNALRYNWSPDNPCHQDAQAGLLWFEQLHAAAQRGDTPRGSSEGCKGRTCGPGVSRPQPEANRRRAEISMSHMVGFSDPKAHAEAIRRQLGEFLVKCGGTADLVDGFEISSQERSTGIAAGSFDTYFTSPEGKRMRSRLEVARHFGLAPETAAEAAKHVKQQEQQEQKLEREQKRQARAQEKLLEKLLRVPRARRESWCEVAPGCDDVSAPSAPLGLPAAQGAPRRRSTPQSTVKVCGLSTLNQQARGAGVGHRRGARAGSARR